MTEQINKQLVSLQDELSRLKKVTDYIDQAKTNSTAIIDELEHIQKKYAHCTEDLYTLYKQSISDLKEGVESKIENDVLRIEEVGNQIHQKSQEQITETRTLLEQYKHITDASSSLIETLQAIDFHAKSEAILSNTEQLIASDIKAKQAIEQKISETQTFVMEKSLELKENVEQLIASEFKKCKSLIQEHIEHNFEWQAKQEKEMEMLKIFTLVVGGLLILSMILMMMK